MAVVVKSNDARMMESITMIAKSNETEHEQRCRTAPSCLLALDGSLPRKVDPCLVSSR